MLETAEIWIPGQRAEGFWDWPVMVTLQGMVDDTRAAADPMYLIMGAFIAVLLVLYLLNRPPGERDRAPPGGHYMGKITPKSLPGMLIEPAKKRKRKSQDEMKAAIRRTAERRRAMENRAEQLGISVEELVEQEGGENDHTPVVRRK